VDNGDGGLGDDGYEPESSVWFGGDPARGARAIIRARSRDDDARPELLERNEVVEYRVRLYPTSYLFKPGHRIRVDISSSNFPRFSRNLNTGEDVATGTRIAIAHQMVLHSSECPSHILLPVVPR